jgi:RHS repeat-associated protein
MRSNKWLKSGHWWSIVSNYGAIESDELNLGWLDYGARMYMPEIGRFSAQDMLSEEYYSWSPYNYVRGNPLMAQVCDLCLGMKDRNPAYRRQVCSIR